MTPLETSIVSTLFNANHIEPRVHSRVNCKLRKEVLNHLVTPEVVMMCVISALHREHSEI
jgi:hypothetical protein